MKEIANKVRLKIFGERNSNTTFLTRIVALNLQVKQLRSELGRPLNYYKSRYPGGETLRDVYFGLTSRFNLGWKHTRVDRAWLEERGAFQGQFCFVTVTKNPYAWLLSLHERPYHQHHTDALTFEEFLLHPWRLVSRDNCSGSFLTSPMELWNVKTRSYLSLTGPHCVATSSEQLLDNPARVIDRIGMQFGIPRLTTEFVNHETSTNLGAKSFSDYREYYLEERWKTHLSNEALAIINAQIDVELMSSLGYELLAPAR